MDIFDELRLFHLTFTDDLIVDQLKITPCSKIWSAHFSREVHSRDEGFVFYSTIIGSEFKPQGFLYESVVKAF